jgi:hypothetical protein
MPPSSRRSTPRSSVPERVGSHQSESEAAARHGPRRCRRAQVRQEQGPRDARADLSARSSSARPGAPASLLPERSNTSRSSSTLALADVDMLDWCYAGPDSAAPAVEAREASSAPRIGATCSWRRPAPRSVTVHTPISGRTGHLSADDSSTLRFQCGAAAPPISVSAASVWASQPHLSFSVGAPEIRSVRSV